MKKYIFLFSSLLSFSLLTYRPMLKRTIDFGDNVCYYVEFDSGSQGNSYIEYVRPCQEGKHCYNTENSEYYLHTCETIPKYRKTIDESCSTDFECDDNLNCLTGNKCGIKDYNQYKVEDSVSGLNIFYCNTEKISIYSSNPDFSDPSSAPTASCQDVDTNNVKTDYDKFYVTKNSVNKYVGIAPYRVPGQISFKTKVEGADYDIESIDFADIGSLSVGTPVYDERACETGFALYFYGDGSLVKPNGATEMYLFCANFKEVLNGKILYSLADGTEKVYNQGKITLTKYSTSKTLSLSQQLIETKLEMFKNYKNNLNLEECKNNYDYTEPYTCKNNELRKWWYFYYHPDEYMLYKDQNEVINYLVQEKFPEYVGVAAGGFIAFKYILYLLILLSL